MDTRLLQAFVLLAETRNYRAAAQRLFITQPALTKQIKTLESTLGLTLFTRGRLGAHLTHPGELLLEKARGLITQAAALSDYAHDVAKGTTGKLHIGFGISGIAIMPALVARFRIAYPDVVVSLEDISSMQQTAQLLSGQLQLAFMRLPAEPPLTGRKLVRETLVLAVKSRSALSRRMVDARTYRMLATLPLIQLLPDNGPGLFRQVEHFLAVNHVTPDIVQQTKDMQTLLALVAAGVGVAIVPASAMHIAPSGVDMIPLHGASSQWDVGMAWHPALADPLCELFMAIVDSNPSLFNGD